MKTFEGKANFLKKIEDFLSVKQDLDNIGKKIFTVDRIDEMSRILNLTFVNCPSEKQRLGKMRGTKDKVSNEMRDFDALSTRKEKISLARI
jgi:hypothetical protein